VISITIVFSENGILRQAEKAKEFQANAEVRDEEIIDDYDQQAANAINSKWDAMQDSNPPELASIVWDSNTIYIGQKAKATVSQNDLGTGIAIEKCKWILDSSDKPIGTEEEKYTGEFMQNPQEIEITIENDGFFYLHVLSVDMKGNKRESISEKLEVEIEDFIASYTGNVQQYVVPKSGNYKIECWGASGGSSNLCGAYTSGVISLTEGTTLFVYVGQIGSGITGKAVDNPGTFNGGGPGGRGGTYGNQYPNGSSGGGATDVRMVGGSWNDSSSLNSRIIVAAGAGGIAGICNTGAAGGLTGYGGLTQNYQR